MQYSLVTYQFGDIIRSTPFQLRVQWFSNAAAYATRHVSNSSLLLCCALIALVSSVVGVMRHDCHKDAHCIYKERAALSDAVSGRLKDTRHEIMSYLQATWEMNITQFLQFRQMAW